MMRFGADITKDHTEYVDQIAAAPAQLEELMTAKYEVVVLEGCDGTGKTTIASALAERHGYTVLHSDRPPDSFDLAERYRSVLALPGKIALDRSFISELVYGPFKYGRSRLSAPDAAELAFRVADRGGVLVHLTGRPDVIAARLRARDGYAPPLERIGAVIEAYRRVFDALAGAAPTITADTTMPLP
jgi:thymidylate kinase